VQALNGHELVIAANGKAETFTLTDKLMVILNRRGTLDSIQPGAYIATTNTPLSDDAGRSVTLSVYEPGMASAGVNYVMPTGNMMTNGTVATVARTADGSALEVNYGKGVRKVQTPADSAIILASRGGLGDLKPGAKVTVRSMPDETGARVARFITVGVGGFTPP
jgi:hypothetical protein